MQLAHRSNELLICCNVLISSSELAFIPCFSLNKRSDIQSYEWKRNIQGFKAEGIHMQGGVEQGRCIF